MNISPPQFSMQAACHLWGRIIIYSLFSLLISLKKAEGPTFPAYSEYTHPRKNTNVGSMLARRLWRRANIVPTFVQCLVGLLSRVFRDASFTAIYHGSQETEQHHVGLI